jgi:hypothetical protein
MRRNEFIWNGETGEVIEVEARGLVCETNGMMVH